MLRLGYAYIASSELPQIIQPHLERLSGQIRESCSASILDGGEILYIARAATKRIMSVSLGVGTRLPAYCTSMGRVLLAALDPDEAAKRIASLRRTQFTPHTRTRKEELADILRDVRGSGYCVVDQELEIGLVSMAVPVLNNAGPDGRRAQYRRAIRARECRTRWPAVSCPPCSPRKRACARSSTRPHRSRFRA